MGLPASSLHAFSADWDCCRINPPVGRSSGVLGLHTWPQSPMVQVTIPTCPPLLGLPRSVRIFLTNILQSDRIHRRPAGFLHVTASMAGGAHVLGQNVVGPPWGRSCEAAYIRSSVAGGLNGFKFALLTANFMDQEPPRLRPNCRTHLNSIWQQQEHPKEAGLWPSWEVYTEVLAPFGMAQQGPMLMASLTRGHGEEPP